MQRIPAYRRVHCRVRQESVCAGMQAVLSTLFCGAQLHAPGLSPTGRKATSSPHPVCLLRLDIDDPLRPAFMRPRSTQISNTRIGLKFALLHVTHGLVGTTSGPLSLELSFPRSLTLYSVSDIQYLHRHHGSPALPDPYLAPCR